nr:hypothetical protein K4M20_00368 [Agrobacterium fabrum]
MCWNTCHLWATASGAAALAAIWLAIWPSVIGRRPKGVVTFTAVIVFTFQRQSKSACRSDSYVLTAIPGNAILLVTKLREAFRNAVSEGFFFAQLLPSSPLVPLRAFM